MRICIILLLVLLLLTGCSGKKSNPVEVSSDAFDPVLGSSHQILGTWEITFDIENQTSFIESARSLDAHYNVTSMIPEPVIQLNSWDPVEEIIDCDIMLKNPTVTDVFDVRLIIYTDSDGHDLTNEDAWTSLYDIPDGNQANPFRAYAKSNPYRRFPRNSFYTENFKIKCPSGNFSVQFAVDASLPGNCEEPYEITGFNLGYLDYQLGSSAQAQVTVRDWQNDVSEVKLYCKRVFGDPPVVFSQTSPGLWEATITNLTGASFGSYPGFIEASSTDSGDLRLYFRITVNVLNEAFTGWVRTWGTIQYEKDVSVAVDDSGNIYISATSGRYTYLNRTNIYGDHIWNIRWDMSYSDIHSCLDIRKILIDNFTGSLYIAGFYEGRFDIDPGPVEDWRSSCLYENPDVPGGPAYYYLDNAFLCKLDTYGNYYWGKTWGGNAIYDHDARNSFSSDLAFDNSGNILVAGHFGTNIGQFDLDPGPGEDLHTQFGHNVSRFDPDGNYLGAVSWFESGWHDCTIEINESGEIFAGGSFDYTLDLDPGTGTLNRTAVGFSDVFICKLDSDLSFMDAISWGGPDGEEIYDTALDNADNILVCGKFGNIVDFDPGSCVTNLISQGYNDVFVSKLDKNLMFMWAKAWGGSGGDAGVAIGTNQSGDIFITGIFHETVDMDPGTGLDSHISKGNDDFFLSSLTQDGDFRWARSWGSTSIDNSSSLAINGISQVFTGGDFQKSIDFDPGPGEDIRTAVGYNDAFVLKILPNGYWYE